MIRRDTGAVPPHGCRFRLLALYGECMPAVRFEDKCVFTFVLDIIAYVREVYILGMCHREPSQSIHERRVVVVENLARAA